MLERGLTEWRAVLFDHHDLDSLPQDAGVTGALSSDPPMPTSPISPDLWLIGRALVVDLRNKRHDDLFEQDRRNAVALRQAILDQRSTIATVVWQLEDILSRHAGDDSCIVCKYMAARRAGGFEPGFLDLLDNASQSEKNLALRHHGHVPMDPAQVPDVRRVEVILESHGVWSAVRLQEYVEVRSLGSEPPDLVGESELERGRRQRSLHNEDSGVWKTSTWDLKVAFRHRAKDVCVFVPEEIVPEVVLEEVVPEKTKPADPRGSWFDGLRTSFGYQGPPPPYQRRIETFSNRHGTSPRVTEAIHVDLIKSWLARCKSSHDRCADDLGAYPRGLTLIDVHRMCLVDVPADGSRPRYLALSYVWGTISQPVLKRAVSKKWHTEGGLRAVDIPETIRDAMQLTGMVGYDYVWVDALCIVQDDSAARDHQITQMHEIYQHADVTIVAADGSDCTNGLPGVSKSGSRVKKHGCIDLPGGLRLQKVPLSTRHSIQESPWRTRGWTFQEELCSRRAIVLLPEVMVFSCPSAVWREDLHLEDGETLQRDEGLDSVRPLLLSHGLLDPGSKISLFRDLVKQYVHRTLSRTDDIENAFTGVAGLLGPTLGPIYHGIPEKAFEEVISGCWSGVTTLRRREDFPSWSWTGWIYSSEQTDMGIRPQVSMPYKFSTPLAFYKLLPVVEALGRRPDGDVPHDEMGSSSGLLSHFVPDEAELQTRHKNLAREKDIPSYLIAFHTSCAMLKVRSTPGSAAGASREYRVVHPRTNRQMTSIQLPTDFVEKNGSLHDFIVIAHDRARRCFRLMLISRGQFAAERVNVIAQSRPVSEEDWRELGPRRELIVMA